MKNLISACLCVNQGDTNHSSCTPCMYRPRSRIKYAWPPSFLRHRK